MEIGNQYAKDNKFKAKARLHQSKLRAEHLKVDFDEYGNRLLEEDARCLLNYYPKLNSRAALRRRYPNYSKKRDADMLRSEHIPFNLIAPLETNLSVAREIVSKAFRIEISEIIQIYYEYAPGPKEDYLNDGTAFDAYIACRNSEGKLVGIGIEVKYTEQAYKIGKTEKMNVENRESPYWKVAKESGAFKHPADPVFGEDDLRQIWRNHLLGLAMIQQRLVDEFYSITLFPRGNEHFVREIPKYCEQLSPQGKRSVKACTFEDYIDCIHGSEEFEEWRKWLKTRYIVV